MVADKMRQAEDMRYKKIQRLIDLLCPKQERAFDDLLDDLIGTGLCTPFNVGRWIMVEDSGIKIRNILYHASDIQKVKVNTEGSIWIYGPGGKKLCDWRHLNVSTEHVELFCLWVRKQNVPAEVISARGERIVQWSVFASGVLVIILRWVLNILNK